MVNSELLEHKRFSLFKISIEATRSGKINFPTYVLSLSSVS